MTEAIAAGMGGQVQETGGGPGAVGPIRVRCLDGHEAVDVRVRIPVLLSAPETGRVTRHAGVQFLVIVLGLTTFREIDQVRGRLLTGSVFACLALVAGPCLVVPLQRGPLIGDLDQFLVTVLEIGLEVR